MDSARGLQARASRRSVRVYGSPALAAAAALLLAVQAAADGVMRGQIFTQPRQAMPDHKVRALREARMLDSEGRVPLHAGYGTHYAFLYVGTPPQRVSVIIDTGSHWTAFPCSGCKQCGTEHTDPEFKVEKSSSFHALGCNECKFSSHCSGDKCSVSLSYAEGSRWDAYEAQDVVYLGGDSVDAVVKGGQDLGMPFVFGCQSYETGLFRTQLENGIMGLSNQDLTLVPKLKESGKISSRVFSLCFTGDGGSLAVGGYDTSHHQVPVTFLPLVKDQGWYTIKLVDVKIHGTSIGANPDEYNRGQGTIVDSGTTDTYMPRSMAGAFSRVFKEATGHDYSTRVMSMTEDEFSALPDIVFVFDNGHEEAMPWSSYIECSDDSCAGAIFFENPSGVVLGANFMKGRDVIFDAEERRVGFAKADCGFDAAKASATPTAGADAATPAPSTAAVVPATTEPANVDCELTFGEATGPCDAVCPDGESGVAYGHQVWSMVVGTQPKGKGHPCPSPLPTSTRPCLVNCTGTAKPAEGGAAATTTTKTDPSSSGSSEPAATTKCSTATTWSLCSDKCVQQGTGEAPQVDGSCAPFTLERPCSTGALCGLANRGFAVDFNIILHGLGGNRELTVTDKETLLEDVSFLLQVPGGDLEMLSVSDASQGIPLRLHLTQNSSVVMGSGTKSLLPAQKAAEVKSTVKSETFTLALLAKLKQNGGIFDSLESLELVDGNVHNLDAPVGSEGPVENQEGQKIAFFFWDIVGGAAAVFLLLMLIIHFRWSHWTSVQQQPASSLLNRMRSSVSNVDTSGSKRSTPKPSSRAYERVRDEDMAGATEEIEMI